MEGDDGREGLESAFVAGDEDALHELYERYGPLVFRIGLALLDAVSDAEEVTQATFVSAWLGRATFDASVGTLASWLAGIARRRALDHLRARAREVRTARAAAAHAATAAVPGRGADEAVERIFVASELAALPAQQRRVLELVFFAELTRSQIAEVTGPPAGTVKSHARRGLARLRRQWESDPA